MNTDELAQDLLTVDDSGLTPEGAWVAPDYDALRQMAKFWLLKEDIEQGIHDLAYDNETPYSVANELLAKIKAITDDAKLAVIPVCTEGK